MSLLALQRGTSEADKGLLDQAQRYFAPLPKVIPSPGNPITPEKIRLGKMLFYETRFSIDGTVSCARCHPFSFYGTDRLEKSIGNQGKINPRNAPTVLNSAGQFSIHWVGNRRDVEDQAKQSFIGPASFGMPSYEEVERRLKGISGYRALFRKAFPKDRDPINVDNMAKAIGAFERILVTPSRFDEFLKGKKEALTEKEKRGLRTFIQVGCVSCHNGPYLGGRMYQRFGVVVPYWEYTKSKSIDEGRYTVTKREEDRYVFKVPILRNVAKTAPYFHDGSVQKLEEAIEIMGKVQLGKNLSQQEVEELKAFLESLTGRMPQDALTLPLLP